MEPGLPWSLPDSAGQPGGFDAGLLGPAELFDDGLAGGGSGSFASAMAGGLPLTDPGTSAPWGPASAGGATGRGEFAAGFLWFDALQPDYYGQVKPDAVAAAQQQQQQQQQRLLPTMPAGTPPLPLAGLDMESLPQQPLVPLKHQEQQASAPVTATTPRGGGGVKKGGHGGRGGGGEEDRRARNRATQARFRERQKVGADLWGRPTRAAHPAAAATSTRARLLSAPVVPPRCPRPPPSPPPCLTPRARLRPGTQQVKNEHLSVEYAETEAELSRTRSQQEDLQTQNTVLQKLLLVRDGALAALGGAGPPGQQQEQQEQQEEEEQQKQQQQQQVAAPARQPQQRAQAPAGQPPGQQPGAISSPAGVPAARAAAACLAAGSGSETPDPLGPCQRSSSGSGLSSTIQQHMGWLGHELTAQMAMLELPANAHPDEVEVVAVGSHAGALPPACLHVAPAGRLPHPAGPLPSPHASRARSRTARTHTHTCCCVLLRLLCPLQAMAVAHAQLAPLLDQPMPPLLRQHEVLELTERLQQIQAQHAGSGAGVAAATAGRPPSSSSGAAASTAVGTAASDATVPAAATDSSLRGGSQPIGLAALLSHKPALVRQVAAMTPQEFVADWESKASAFG